MASSDLTISVTFQGKFSVILKLSGYNAHWPELKTHSGSAVSKVANKGCFPRQASLLLTPRAAASRALSVVPQRK